MPPSGAIPRALEVFSCRSAAPTPKTPDMAHRRTKIGRASPVRPSLVHGADDLAETGRALCKVLSLEADKGHEAPHDAQVFLYTDPKK